MPLGLPTDSKDSKSGHGLDHLVLLFLCHSGFVSHCTLDPDLTASYCLEYGFKADENFFGMSHRAHKTLIYFSVSCNLLGLMAKVLWN